MRLFIAIRLPRELKKEIGTLQHSIEDIRWQPQHQFHITFEFCGEVSVTKKEVLLLKLETCEQSPFSVSIKNVKAFPSLDKPETIWVGVEKSPALKSLEQFVEERCISAGLKPKKREYVRHITIGKCRKKPSAAVQQFLDTYQRWSASELEVNQFGLYHSILSQKGATHTLLKRFELSE